MMNFLENYIIRINHLMDAAKMIQEFCNKFNCDVCPFYNGKGKCAFETTPNLWKLEKVNK